MSGHLPAFNAGPAIRAAGAVIPAMALGTGRLRGRILHESINAAIGCGYRHIDTAAKYGNEAEVGEATSSQAVPRDEMFLTTKALPRESEAAFLTDVESSLRNLRVDRVDLLLIHWPDQREPLAGQVSALCRARHDGLAKNIGLSNFPPAYLEAAARYTTEPLAVHQIERHPYLDQARVIEQSTKLGMAIMAFCPLGRGALMDDPVVARIAKAHGRTPAQVVLRWHLQLPQNVPAPSSSRPERIVENFGAFDFALSDEEQRSLSSLVRDDGRVVRGATGYDWNGVPG